MSHFVSKSLPVFIMAMMSLLPKFSWAESIFSGQSGISFGTGATSNHGVRSLSMLLGADYTFAISRGIQIGGFYDHNFLSNMNGTLGALRFFGNVTRYNLKSVKGMFLEWKLGMSQKSSENYTSGLGIGIGAGAGYRIPLGTSASISPKIGVRVLSDVMGDTSSTQGITDLSLMFSMHF